MRGRELLRARWCCTVLAHIGLFCQQLVVVAVAAAKTVSAHADGSGAEILLLPPEAASLFASALALPPTPAAAASTLVAARLPSPPTRGSTRRRPGPGGRRVERIQHGVGRLRGAAAAATTTTAAAAAAATAPTTSGASCATTTAPGPSATDDDDATSGGVGAVRDSSGGPGAGGTGALPPVTPIRVSTRLSSRHRVPDGGGGAAAAGAGTDVDVAVFEEAEADGDAEAGGIEGDAAAAVDDEPEFRRSAPTRLDALHVVSALALFCRGQLRDRAGVCLPAAAAARCRPRSCIASMHWMLHLMIELLCVVRPFPRRVPRR